MTLKLFVSACRIKPGTTASEMLAGHFPPVSPASKTLEETMPTTSLLMAENTGLTLNPPASAVPKAILPEVIPLGTGIFNPQP